MKVLNFDVESVRLKVIFPGNVEFTFTRKSIPVSEAAGVADRVEAFRQEYKEGKRTEASFYVEALKLICDDFDEETFLTLDIVFVRRVIPEVVAMALNPELDPEEKKN